jgi:hypothetical protein
MYTTHTGVEVTSMKEITIDGVYRALASQHGHAENTTDHCEVPTRSSSRRRTQLKRFTIDKLGGGACYGSCNAYKPHNTLNITTIVINHSYYEVYTSSFSSHTTLL